MLPAPPPSPAGPSHESRDKGARPMENTQADEGQNGPGGQLETFAWGGGPCAPTQHSRTEQRGRQRPDIPQRSTGLSFPPSPLWA